MHGVPILLLRIWLCHSENQIEKIDDKYIRESLIDPLKYIAEGYTPIMQSYKPVLSDEDIESLALYYSSLEKPVGITKDKYLENESHKFINQTCLY